MLMSLDYKYSSCVMTATYAHGFSSILEATFTIFGLLSCTLCPAFPAIWKKIYEGHWWGLVGRNLLIGDRRLDILVLKRKFKYFKTCGMSDHIWRLFWRTFLYWLLTLGNVVMCIVLFLILSKQKHNVEKKNKENKKKKKKKKKKKNRKKQKTTTTRTKKQTKKTNKNKQKKKQQHHFSIDSTLRTLNQHWNEIISTLCARWDFHIFLFF